MTARVAALGRVCVWACAIGVYLALAIWLVAHPAFSPSDDALFFSRALVRYSILDFSPQFPGYPGFIALGRIVRVFVGDANRALLLSTIMLALGAPPACALIVRRLTKRRGFALCAFLLALTQPLTPDMALNMMSDGAGVFFFLVFLALIPCDSERARERPWRSYAAGAALGWAACCRPSDAALFIGAIVGLSALRRQLFPIVATAGCIGAAALVVLTAREGLAYWSEGVRFVSGHAQLWGNTPFSERPRSEGWAEAIATRGRWLAPGVLVALAAAIVVARHWRRALLVERALCAAILCAGVETVLFQNPDQFRHLAPLMILGGTLGVLALRNLRGGVAFAAAAIAINVAALAASCTFDPLAPPPIAQAIAGLAAAPPDSAIATNVDVETLKQALPALRVYDLYYPADAELGMRLARGKAFRLSTSPLALFQRNSGRKTVHIFAGITLDAHSTPLAVWPARFIGEQTLFLYRAARQGAP